MEKVIGSFMLAIVLCFAATAQEDAAGCKDHPLFNRLSNFLIEECQENFNAVDFQTGPNDKKENLEGNVITIRYYFNSQTSGKMPSPLQIIRNYDNAIVKNGGKKIYGGNDDVEGGPLGGTYALSANGKQYMVAVRKMYEPGATGEVGAYTLYVLEKEPMQQEIQANEIFDALNKDGSVALYINFETGKSIIQPESEKTIEQIAEMLRSNPSLKVSIEGHTDNTGKAEANQKLSESRASAVMKAVAGKGISASRLASRGWGNSKPVADNNNEEGKAKNRRVEIVKM